MSLEGMSEYANVCLKVSRANSVSVLEDLNQQFGRLRIDNQEHEAFTRQDVIVNVLKPYLSATRELEFVTKDHACFEPVKRVREKWNIGDAPYINFVELLCGCLQFPLILLQNPSKRHTESFESMQTCPTIRWISRKLDGMGLELKQVSVLDICSLFSDDDLEQMSAHDRKCAREDAYKMTEDVLKILRPQVIVCCQCKTRGVYSQGKCTWPPAENKLANDLCSNVAEARDRVATPLEVEGHSFWAVKGVHPMYVLYNPGKENILNELFEDMYYPCGAMIRLLRLIDSTEKLVAAFEFVSSSIRVAFSVTENRVLLAENAGRLLDPTENHLAAIENFALHLQEGKHRITRHDGLLRLG
ncbi:hypothetical protein HIM_11313 [Hirsutella minnesotensis 3608]|uniref:Uncharacterized protein n=1 Tax=Hirsutella minnesotensis 3608 TaxID=1043627 RepID=A0A0F7ZJ53_9HYPO|nr:hypothetical protein HIM_11313 [Hirsutella minnesotensis 3608]